MIYKIQDSFRFSWKYDYLIILTFFHNTLKNTLWRSKEHIALNFINNKSSKKVSELVVTKVKIYDTQ